ncbi:MAG: hypothetical protein IKT52_11860 [Oscillospiraceae bacterium]|nr:hypothetical protein [Oscillospiraceae bacterium]
MKSMNGVVRYDRKSELHFATWNDKFPEEKVCFENEDYLIHFDGIILNSNELKSAFNCNSNQSILLQLYKSYGSELVFHAKGLYALVLWDKQAQTLLVTNDLLSKRPLYYHRAEHGLCYASSYYDILDILSAENVSPAFRMDAFEDMLQDGFVSGNKTYLHEVFYLKPFESLVVDLKNASTQLIHHQPKAFDLPDTEEAAAARFEELFSAAVKLQFQKNTEYGYRQCAALSGGMDSRACVLKAHQLGLTEDLVCFNYAQSDSLDFTISRKIAIDHGFDYLYYPMDAALFLSRLEESMCCNECQQDGIGATGARTMISLMNTSGFGLINIGICGGELMGDLVQTTWQKAPSSRLLRLLNLVHENIRARATTEETKAEDYCFDADLLFDHMRLSKNSSQMFVDKCESVSPFMDEDVVMFILQLNPGFLFHRKMYRRWMVKYLPNPYVLTSTCTPVDSSLLQEILVKLKYELQARLKGISAREMNPIDRWLETLPHHAQSCTCQYEQTRQWLGQTSGTEEILCAATTGWDGGWSQRLLVLTALHAAKDICSRFSK